MDQGGNFDVESLKFEDLNAGVVNSSWLPKFAHPNVPAEEEDAFAAPLLRGFLMSISSGAWKVTDDAWNKILPCYKFAQPEDFLTAAWAEIEADSSKTAM